MKSPATLKICVMELVRFTNPFARRRNRKKVRSPYFQPKMTFSFNEETDWSTTKPRGPSIIIDMEMLGAAFE